MVGFEKLKNIYPLRIVYFWNYINDFSIIIMMEKSFVKWALIMILIISSKLLIIDITHSPHEDEDSCAVMAYTTFCCDMIAFNRVTLKTIYHGICITMENSLVKWVPAKLFFLWLSRLPCEYVGEVLWPSYLYTPAQRSWRGYTGFTLSVCPSVRPSVCRRHGFRSISQVCFGISISYACWWWP